MAEGGPEQVLEPALLERIYRVRVQRGAEGEVRLVSRLS